MFAASAAAPASTLPATDHLRILSRPDWVEPVVLFLRDKALAAGVCNAETADRLVVAMTEAITNAIVHGNFEIGSELKRRGDDSFARALSARVQDPCFVSRIVDIQADYTRDRATWTVTDQGHGFDVPAALARLEGKDPQERRARSRGLAILRAFVDEVKWDSGGRRVRLCLYRKHDREKRGQRRVAYVKLVLVQVEGRPAASGIARDLSPSGIAFVSQNVFDRGTRAALTLDLDHTHPRQTTGRIVRCDHVSGPYYDVAMHFDQPLESQAA